MGRPKVTKNLPEFVTVYRDQHGKLRYRFRRTGYPSAYLRNEPGTEAFWQEYLALSNAKKIEVGVSRIAPGTFDDLITQFYKSTAWRNIPKDTTRRVYRGELERFRVKYGDRTVRTMTAQNVAKLMEKMADTPSAATNLLKRLRQLFDYSILIGMRRDNPAKAVRAPRTTSKGFHTWSEDEIAAYEARWPLGTRERLALALLLYTAQRRSDIVTMGPQHVKDGRIRVKQLKTAKPMLIPMHYKLKEAIESCPSGQLAFLVTDRGTPFVKESFGNWFRVRCNKAGLSKCSAHGLRKSAARRMAEQGLSNQLIKSITGHSSDSEVARYTRDAEQSVMADKAMAVMVRSDLSNLKSDDLSNLSETNVKQG